MKANLTMVAAVGAMLLVCACVVSLARPRRRHPDHSTDARPREHHADAAAPEHHGRGTQERTGGELEQQRPTASTRCRSVMCSTGTRKNDRPEGWLCVVPYLSHGTF